MTSLTFQQKQNKLLICYFPNYKLVESFDPPREHQHKFQQHITFFPSWDRKKFALCLQCSHFHSYDSKFISESSQCRSGLASSPPLHWQPYSTTSLKQQRIYRAWVSSEQSHMPLAVAKSCSPRKRSKLFAGRTGPCPANNQDFTKQALMHRISTLTSKALAIECMGSKYKTHEELDGN